MKLTSVFVRTLLLLGFPNSLRFAQADDVTLDFAYTSNHDGQVGVYHHNADGERLLTERFKVAEAPSWAPNGEQIAFQAKVGEQFDIFVLNVGTGEFRQLTNSPENDFHPVWSPDGGTIAFWSNRSSNCWLWLIDVDGNNERKFPVELSDIASFSWSPDGKQTAFCTPSPLEKDLSKTDLFRVSLECDICLADARGENSRKIASLANSVMSPSWSPDGRRLVFSQSSKPFTITDFQIFVVNVDGSELQQLTTEPGQNLCPKWSPDGKTVVYYCNAIAQDKSPVIPRLYAISPDGTKRAAINVGEFGGYFPDFRQSVQTKR